jgi:Holliday junction resolvasome RuvABC endonuclease subunit
LKVAGIDPSSSVCGVAITEDEKLLLTDAWFKPKNKSAPERLVDYFIWLQSWLTANEPDIAVVEFLSVERNAESTRMVSHYQAISVLVCKLRGRMVIEARVTSARKVALGRGNMKKEEVYTDIKKKYPQHKFRGFKSGGADETDAVVLSLSASLAER